MEKLHFLPIVWSDAIILESNNHFAMIDVGSRIFWDKVNSYLKSLRVKKLDFIVITHWHVDHFGCLKYILDEYDVEKVYIKKYSNHESTTGNGHLATDEDRENGLIEYNEYLTKVREKSELIVIDGSINDIIFENFSIKLFNTIDLVSKSFYDIKSYFYKQYKYNENYNSMTVLIEVNKNYAYLGGDIPDFPSKVSYMEYLNTRIIKEINKVIPVFKASHHGTNLCYTKEMFSIMKPEYAIITNTDENVYKKYDIVNYLKEENPNIDIFTTYKKSVVISFLKNKEIKCKVKELNK